MYSDTIDIEKINTELLDSLIADKDVDSESLKSQRLFNIESINYFFLYDCIAIPELSEYFKVDRTTIWRKYSYKRNKQVNISSHGIRNKTALASFKPKNIFSDIYEYGLFLKWRSNKKKNVKNAISVKDAANISGNDLSTIYRLIKDGTLISIYDGKKKISIPSFIVYLKDEYRKAAKQQKIMENFLIDNSKDELCS